MLSSSLGLAAPVEVGVGAAAASAAGFGAVLGAYGNLSAAKFRELWAAKMPADTPFPEELIQRGAGSVSLRRVSTKPTTTNS